MNTGELETFLLEQIPLASSMGLKIEHADFHSVILRAPLAPNRNHLGGAFGGSLQSLLIFSCYTWLFHHLIEDGNCHVLIQSAKTDYLHPVKEDMKIVCPAPKQDDLETFMKIYERKGRARLRLSSYVEISTGRACVFEGEFVAEKSRDCALD